MADDSNKKTITPEQRKALEQSFKEQIEEARQHGPKPEVLSVLEALHRIFHDDEAKEVLRQEIVKYYGE